MSPSKHSSPPYSLKIFSMFLFLKVNSFACIYLNTFSVKVGFAILLRSKPSFSTASQANFSYLMKSTAPPVFLSSFSPLNNAFGSFGVGFSLIDLLLGLKYTESSLRFLRYLALSSLIRRFGVDEFIPACSTYDFTMSAFSSFCLVPSSYLSSLFLHIHSSYAS